MANTLCADPLGEPASFVYCCYFGRSFCLVCLQVRGQRQGGACEHVDLRGQGHR